MVPPFHAKVVRRAEAATVRRAAPLSSGAALGNLLDPSRIVLLGDFDHDGRAEPLAYDSTSGTWSMGHSDGTISAGNTSGSGDLTR